MQIELYDQVVAALKMCPRSLFIFDEVDKMPEGIFDILKSLLDYHGGHKGLNTREAVFIFLSNAGGRLNASENYNYILNIYLTLH